MTAKLFILAHTDARKRACQFIAEAPAGYTVAIAPPKRSLDQNARLWVLLGALSDQVVWHGQKLTAAEWKDMATAALKQQKVVPGIEGGFVVLGSSTSAMTKAELGDLMTFIEAFGAERGVNFNDQAQTA